MEDNEVITLNVDVGEAAVALEDMLEGFGALKTLAKDIGIAISKAFVPMQKSLLKTQTSIYAMTDALAAATSAMQGFSEQLAAEQGGDWFAEVLSAITSGGSFFVDLIANADDLGAAFAKVGSVIATAFSSTGILGKAFETIGKTMTSFIDDIVVVLHSINPIVAIVVAVVLAAIAAVIVFWDEIKLFFTDTLPQLWAQFVERISGIGASVAETFAGIMSVIGQFFTDCWNGIVTAFTGVGQWLQENVIQPIVETFTPIVEWFAALFGSIWQTVSDIFYNIGVIISGCWEILVAVWGVVAEWFDTNVIQPVVGFFVGLWTNVSTWAVNAWNSIKEVFNVVATWFNENVVQPVASFLSGMWEGFTNAAKQAWEAVKSVFSKVTGFFKDIFTKAWNGVVGVFSIAGEIFTNIKDGILSAFKKIVNGIITGINSAVSVPFNGINLALEKIKGINILGLTPFSGLTTINVPQIPYLAKGAVLPANRPFLAVVGDQRHGTNVEAPLSTIQEAVALVMDDHIAAMMAGFQALLKEQQATRQTIENIRVGDSVIGEAAQRYNRKMAVALGTY